MKTQEQVLTCHPMKWALCLAATLTFSPCFAQFQPQTVNDGNSTLRYNIREESSLPTVPSSPVQFPGSIEWTVEGRRILVYPSVPGNSVDVGHAHPGAPHVANNQIHIQGPLFGYSPSDVTVGVVYTLKGGTSGSGVSRISEKVDIRNKSNAPVPLGSLTGLGWLPDRSAPHNANVELPDLTGLNVTGTTVAFIQGDIFQGTPRPLITDSPYGPLTAYPATSFTGFNPFLVRNVTLEPGATLTVFTELNVGPPSQNVSSVSNQNTSAGESQGIPEEAMTNASGEANPNDSSERGDQDSQEKIHNRSHKK